MDDSEYEVARLLHRFDEDVSRTPTNETVSYLVNQLFSRWPRFFGSDSVLGRKVWRGQVQWATCILTTRGLLPKVPGECARWLVCRQCRH